MIAPHIYIKNAQYSYNAEILFRNLSLEIPPKKWIALIGPSGVGKSSLLRMIAGITSPEEKSSGMIYADNQLPIKDQIAFMAQTDLLLPWMTVLDNVTLGLKLRAYTHNEYNAGILKAKALLEKVGLKTAIHFYPYQLSGGMRQRTALLRTLMEKKSIVLMDEPFSALDAITRYKLQNLAVELLKDKTVFFITHDPAEALRLANEIYIMQGKPAQLKLLAHMTTNTPRKLTNPEVMKFQSLLFQELGAED